MGRAVFALGTADRGSHVMDGSAQRVFFKVKEPRGDSASGSAGTGAVLPFAPASEAEGSTKKELGSEAEVMKAELWSQLPLSERERFGHCFSCLVLKAVGLRSCSAHEVEP